MTKNHFDTDWLAVLHLTERTNASSILVFQMKLSVHRVHLDREMSHFTSDSIIYDE